MNKTIIGLLAIFSIGFFTVATPASAAVDLFGGEEANIEANIGLTGTAPQVIIARLINITLGFVGIIFLGLVVYGGYLWMISAGDPAKIEKAKKLLMAAVIGLILVLSSWAIARFIINKLNGAVGPGSATCVEGQTKACGCGGTGLSTCDASGSWGACVGDLCGPAAGASCDDNPMTPLVCDVNVPPQGSCGAGKICDIPTCKCIPALGGVGSACNGTSTPAVCEPDANKCDPLLQCAPAGGPDECTCVGAPVIDWISPKDGAGNPVGTPGNFITIGGRFFGTTAGQVKFYDSGTATTSIVAQFPNAVNAACGNTWTENQIVVIVPAGADDGPIQVVRDDNQEDTTDNTRGPAVPDFKDDNLVRPGLCLSKNNTADASSTCFNKSCGYFNETFKLQGIHFNGAARTILLGGSTGSTSANGIVWGGTNLFADASVPDLNPAKTRVFLKVDGRFSNELNFEVFQNNSRRPHIDYIDPGAAKRSDYITIYGSNFGSKPGQVTFNPGALPADVSFPKGCENYWHDTYIIVKVAPAANIGANQVTVKTADSSSTPSQTSDPADFTVNAGAPGPGICSIKPRNGEVGQIVDVLGERFGAWGGPSATEFYNVVQSTTTASANWNPGNNGKIKTDVPTGAETGPFKVVDSAGNKSNSLNFMVGKCTADNQCDVPGGEQCCAGGTKDGLCATDCGSAGVAVDATFGWDFFTGSTTPPQTCAGYPTAAQCLSAASCPNSPGQCQMSATGPVADCGDANCNAKFAACAGACVYDAGKDKCESSVATCSVASTTIIAGFTANCAKVGVQSVWQVDVGKASCPLGTFKDTNGKCSVGTLGVPQTCDTCPGGFACNAGACVINQDICPGSTSCNAANKCEDAGASTCECCCRVANSEQDCCPGLTCVAGGCGNDPAVYGQCQGCRVDIDGNINATTPQEQDLSDQACNCTGGSTRRCDFDAADPTDIGTCVDTSTIGGPCDDENPDTAACVNPLDANCAANQYCVPAGQPNECTCQAVPPVVNQPCDGDETTPVCDPDATKCADPINDTCYNNPLDPADPLNCTCQPNAGAGDLCQDAANPACSVGVDACGADYSCLDQAGADCRCCCTPGGPPNAAGLECVADVGSCSGATRGLFCGCSTDAQCGNPSIDACGTDTCCHTRPDVASTLPANNAVDVCRNPLIQVNFDQPMDVNSFSGNVILVGDYGASVCPPETTFLTSVPRKGSLWARTWNKVKTLFGGTATALVGNFCAVVGTTNGYNDQATGNGILNFAPQQLLDPNTDYYVIVKGDASSTDGIKGGVLSSFGIAMDATDAPSAVGLNAVNHYGYNWKFRTMPLTAVHDGVCKLEKISLVPPSYTFTKAGATTTITAYPETNSGVRVVPVAGYDWTWSWLSEDTTVVNVTNGNAPLQLVTAGNKKDARTYVDIQTKIFVDTVNKPSTKDKVVTGKALMRLFLCANPWPPISNVVTWPWQDAAGNCNVAGTGACDNYNFEFYYCRDGQASKDPALPAIQNSSTTPIRGSYNDILKEYFFLRAGSPAVLGGLTTTTPAVGGQIILTWLTAGADGYKVYYGTQPGKYDNYIDRGNSNNAVITKLTNGKKYYFTVKAYSNASGGTAAESEYWGEVWGIPKDTLPPPLPLNIKLGPTPSTIKVSWENNPGDVFKDTAKYKVYFGTAAGVYAQSFDVGKSVQSTLTGLSKGVQYFITVTALDASGNESDKAMNEVSTTTPMF